MMVGLWRRDGMDYGLHLTEDGEMEPRLPIDDYALASTCSSSTERYCTLPPTVMNASTATLSDYLPLPLHHTRGDRTRPIFLISTTISAQAYQAADTMCASKFGFPWKSD